MKRKILFLCLLVLIWTIFPMTAMAQEMDYDKKGSISLTLTSQYGEEPLNGAELSVYYVGTMGVNSYGELNYIYTEDFEECGIALDDAALIAKLDAFVSERDIPCEKIITNSYGKAICTELPLGLYLVKQTNEVNGFAPCTSFLVTIPIDTGDGYEYDINASPKTDVVKFTDITIKKVWNTDKSTELPSSVTVQLLRDNVVIKTATLNAKNNWKVTFSDMPVSDSYTVVEKNVPKGYTATYSEKDFVFTVTNTPALAQTGQLVWPIPVLAIVGLILITVGAVILRVSRDENG